MSSLGPDGTILDEPAVGRVHASTCPPREAASDVSAAPLWTAFRDRYTRARERRHVGENEALDASRERALGDASEHGRSKAGSPAQRYCSASSA